MSMQDDETLRLYVEESIEHLADIENDLLAIEKDGADINEELVNKVFRAAHSIKGGAGFMGLNNIKELSHKMENVLGMIREREMAPNPEIVNILLLASDTLRNLLNNVGASNEMPIEEHVTALIALTTGAVPEKKAETRVEKKAQNIDLIFDNGRIVFNVTASDMANSRKKGQFIYLAELDLVQDIEKKGLTAAELLKRLSESGTILSNEVDVQSVGTLDKYGASSKVPFLVLFGTILEPEMVNALFDIDEENIYLLESDNNFIRLTEYGESKASSETREMAEEIPVQQPEEKPFKEETPSYSASETASGTAASKESDPSVSTSGKIAESSLRVNVSLLDSLMTLAGELVLGRNQLLQSIAQKDIRVIEGTGQRLDLITSEIQEAIMMTRMQPIGNVLNKFPRVVRDLARNLKKEVKLTIEGEGVELDKTILEAINDPLTHLVRNSVDHGIELPAERQRAGKEPVGHVMLKAYHEAGQVNIEIRDDGKGMNPDKLIKVALEKKVVTEEQAISMSDKEKINLIFLPGFSTAEIVSDVSGRGVGMDVVKTNLDKLGGVVDIESAIGKGTIIKIKLPLTLAIIPSQLISVCGERYAIPQVNLEELFRIPANQVKDRIEKVGDAEVVRLRGSLLPLIRLADVIGIKREYLDPNERIRKYDRRESISDRRGRKSPLKKASKDNVTGRNNVNNEGYEETDTDNDNSNRRQESTDRRYHAASAVNIVVVYTGALKYGLVVDELFDSEEIVVKPLGRHIKHCKAYAGATIMGDGRVALILDVAGISKMARLTSMDGTERAVQVAKEQRIKNQKDIQSLLIFRNAEDEQFAIPLGLVERVEKIKRSEIEHVGGKKVIQYRGASLPLFAIEQVANVKPLADKEDLLVIVFSIGGRDIGLLATPPLDSTEEALSVDDTTLKQPGIMGSAIIENQTTLMVNIFGIVETLNPEWFTKKETVMVSDSQAATVLYAEDSNFFRGQVTEYLREDGYNVIEAEDGQIALDLIEKRIDDISLIITDIEMPNMDGFELTSHIKKDDRFKHLPVIALTTMASDDDILKGSKVGIDDYQIKLDKEKLMKSVSHHLRKILKKKA